MSEKSAEVIVMPGSDRSRKLMNSQRLMGAVLAMVACVSLTGVGQAVAAPVSKTKTASTTTKRVTPARARTVAVKSTSKKPSAKKASARSASKSSNNRTVKKATSRRAPASTSTARKTVKKVALNNANAKKGLIANLISKTKNALAAKKSSREQKKTTSQKVAIPVSPVTPPTPVEGGVAPITVPAGVVTPMDASQIHSPSTNSTEHAIPVTTTTKSTTKPTAKNVSVKKAAMKSGAKTSAKKMSGKKVGKVGKAKVRTHHFEEL